MSVRVRYRSLHLRSFYVSSPKVPRHCKQADGSTDYDGKATAHIVQQMKDEGYLVRSTKSRLIVVNSAEQLEIMRNDYGNPMTMIKSHVSN